MTVTGTEGPLLALVRAPVIEFVGVGEKAVAVSITEPKTHNGAFADDAAHPDPGGTHILIIFEGVGGYRALGGLEVIAGGTDGGGIGGQSIGAVKGTVQSHGVGFVVILVGVGVIEAEVATVVVIARGNAHIRAGFFNADPLMTTLGSPFRPSPTNQGEAPLMSSHCTSSATDQLSLTGANKWNWATSIS